MTPLHAVMDPAKVSAIRASLEEDGWVGAPLVVDGDQLLTGVHRYAAAKSLDWRDAEIPTVELADLFAEAGLNMVTCHAEWGYPTGDEPAFVNFVEMLPLAIREVYGIDIH